MVQRAFMQLKAIYLYEIRNPIFIRQMLWTAALWVVMMWILFNNIRFMNDRYPDPPQPPDLILDLVGPNDKFVAAGELFSAAQIMMVLFFFLSSRERFRRMPHLLALIGIVYLVRAHAILLTPLAQIQPPSENYDEAHLLAKYFYHGMFFSGHSANAMIQVLFFRNDRWHGISLSWFILPLAVGQMTSLLISHQHYSIDVFGALFVAYFVATFDFQKLIPPALRRHRYMPWYTSEVTASEPDSIRGNGHFPDEAIPKKEADQKVIQPTRKGRQESS